MLFILSCLALMAGSTAAQWGWRNPRPQGNDLWNVSFATASPIGWAVGNAGIIVRTTNGGATWETQESSVYSFLRGVKAIGPTTALAAGDDGVVLSTTDGGTTWVPLTRPTTEGINQVTSTGSGIYCVGDNGLIFFSTNGTTWTPQASNASSNLNDICFVDQQRGWCVGAGKTIRRTTDGGATWVAQTVFGPMADLLGVFFLDAQHGWAAGTYGTVLMTTNGGNTWTRSAGTGTTQDLNKVVFLDAMNGYACGENGTILRSTDGGATWSALASGTTNGFEGMVAGGGTTTAVVLVGLEGEITRSSSAMVFGSVVTGARAALNAVAGAVVNAVWAVGDAGTIVKSSDGGWTWQVQNSGTQLPLYAVCAVDALRAWACGSGGVILRTTDGGAVWTVVPSGVTSALNGIDFPTPTVGFAVGAGGRILKSTNGGAAWTPVPSGTFKDLFAVDMLTDMLGTAVGADGVILRTTNGGATWVPQTSYTLDALFSVVLSADRGWVSGDAGVLLATTNAGADWDSTTTNVTVPIYRVVQTSPTDLFAVGEGGLILRSSDGGWNWTPDPVHTTYAVYGAALAGGVAFCTGEYGMVLANASYPTPVTLSLFSVEPLGSSAFIRWETAQEEGVVGFLVERHAGRGWEQRAFFPARSGDGSGARYSLADPCGDRGGDTVRYRLRCVDMDGTETLFPEAEVFFSFFDGGGARLETVAPNPVTSRSVITIFLSPGWRAAPSLVMYDRTGRQVLDLTHTVLTAGDGRLSIPVDMRDFPSSGTYYGVLKTGDAASVIPITVVK
ncbi:MAG: YCF48-related protein [Bacteroidota bacterium]|nr:YCF48-related protein [Bacteroidota bacterium]